MSSEQEQFELRLSDLMGDIHMDSVSTTITTEEEEIDQQLLATLESKLGQIHNDTYKEVNELLSVAAEESTDENMMNRLSELLGSIHMDTVPTNEEEESNTYMIRKALGGLHMPDDHQVEKKEDPLYYVVRKFIVLSNVVGVTPAGSSAPTYNKQNSKLYDRAARLLDTRESGKQLATFWVKKGKPSDNAHYLGQYHNQIHPYLKLSGDMKVSGEDVSLMQCIRVLNKLREELTKTCPWMYGNPALRVAYIPWNHIGFDWLNQVTDPEKKRVLQKVMEWKHKKKKQKAAQEKVLVLELQAGLLSNWNQYSAKVHEWLRGDENEEGLLTGYIRWAFFKWAGVTDLSQWKGSKDIGVTETQMKVWFEEYKRNPIVERFIDETDQIAKDSAKLIDDALPKLERINQHYTNKRNKSGYNCRVYIGEKYNRVKNGEVVPTTLPSGEVVPNNKELAYELFYQLHHCTIGDIDGKARKRDTRYPRKADGTEGAMKQPVEYTREEMDFQNPGMKLVSEYYHALVDKKQKAIGRVSTNLRHGMTDKLILEHNKHQCLVNSKHVANINNIAAFHSHHLTLGYKAKIGALILETTKISEVSVIKRVKATKSYPKGRGGGRQKSMNIWYQLIENLFPELIITRLLDCRYHRLFHYLLNNPSLMKELNLKFPYKFDEKRNLMISTRTKVDDEEKEVLKLPSVMEVLQIEGEEVEGVCRQSYLRQQKKGNRMTAGEDDDFDFGESDTDSDSELE